VSEEKRKEEKRSAQKPQPIIVSIIHSKYFPVFDWLKPNA